MNSYMVYELTVTDGSKRIGYKLVATFSEGDEATKWAKNRAFAPNPVNVLLVTPSGISIYAPWA